MFSPSPSNSREEKKKFRDQVIAVVASMRSDSTTESPLDGKTCSAHLRRLDTKIQYKEDEFTFTYISSPSAFKMSFHTSFNSLFSATVM